LGAKKKAEGLILDGGTGHFAQDCSCTEPSVFAHQSMAKILPIPVMASRTRYVCLLFGSVSLAVTRAGRSKHGSYLFGTALLLLLTGWPAATFLALSTKMSPSAMSLQRVSSLQICS